MKKIWLGLFGILFLTGCAPNRPCLKSHETTNTYLQCYSYDKNMTCTLYMPVTYTETVCDLEGTPYPEGDSRR